jgi:hypothetical protein
MVTITTKTCTLACLAMIWHVGVDNDESKELRVGIFSDHRTFPSAQIFSGSGETNDDHRPAAIDVNLGTDSNDRSMLG